MQVSFWILLVAFAAAERFVVHVHFRRSAHSMSLGEIPLVFAPGLRLGPRRDPGRRDRTPGRPRRAPPPAPDPPRLQLRAVPAGQLHRGDRLPRRRRLGDADRPDRLGRRGAGHRRHLDRGRAAHLRRRSRCRTAGSASPRSPNRCGTDLAVAAVNTSIGLCAATVVYNDWRAAILMAVPVIGMYLTFQAYVAERQRHGRLEFLYEAARALSRTPDIGSALEGLLAQALDAFRAEVAEIIFFSPDGNDALRTTVRANGAGSAAGGPGARDRRRAARAHRRPGARRLRHPPDHRRPAGRLPGAARAGPRHVRRARRRAQLHGRDDDRQPVGSRRPLLHRRRQAVRDAGQQHQRRPRERPPRAHRVADEGAPARARAPGLPRPPDRSGQPSAVRRAGVRGARARPRERVGDLHRHQRLQDDQRHAGPRRRRRAAHRHQPPAERLRAPVGHAGPAGRRRVRDHARAHLLPGGGDPGRRADQPAAGRALLHRRAEHLRARQRRHRHRRRGRRAGRCPPRS